MSVKRAMLELEITRLEEAIAKKQRKAAKHPNDEHLIENIKHLGDVLTQRYAELEEDRDQMDS